MQCSEAYSNDGARAPVEHNENGSGLIEAIAAYRAGMAQFDQEASEVSGETDELARTTYMPPLDVLVEWQQPAANREEAVAALKLALSESPVAVIGGTFVQPMMECALQYLDASPTDGMASLEALISEHRTLAAEAARLYDIAADLEARHSVGHPKVQVGRLYRGRDEAGEERYSPIYAYFDDDIDAKLDSHRRAYMAMTGNSPKIAAQFDEKSARLKAELAEARRAHKEAEDAAGITAADAELDAAYARVDAVGDRFYAFRPATFAELKLCLSHLLWSFESSCTGCSDDDFPTTIQGWIGEESEVAA